MQTVEETRKDENQELEGTEGLSRLDDWPFYGEGCFLACNWISLRARKSKFGVRSSHVTLKFPYTNWKNLKILILDQLTSPHLWINEFPITRQLIIALDKVDKKSLSLKHFRSLNLISLVSISSLNFTTKWNLSCLFGVSYF